MIDNEINQSKVAYGDSPKEVNHKRGLHNSDRKFGKANKMPQENKGYKQRDYPANPRGLDLGSVRHKEPYR